MASFLRQSDDTPRRAGVNQLFGVHGDSPTQARWAHVGVVSARFFQIDGAVCGKHSDYCPCGYV